jgi:hypothetical protein
MNVEYLPCTYTINFNLHDGGDISVSPNITIGAAEVIEIDICYFNMYNIYVYELFDVKYEFILFVYVRNTDFGGVPWKLEI